jgi:hypothetical protein
VTAPRRSIVELVLAAAALAGAVWSWLSVRSTSAVAPIIDGEPSTTSVTYDPPMMALTLLLVTVAGVLAVVAIARWRRSR